MDANALIALTVGAGATASATGTVLAPIFLMYLTARQRRLEKDAEYAREDAREARILFNQAAVARQAETAAQLLLESNAKVAEHARTTAKELLDSNLDIKKGQDTLNEGQKVIHGLVNSALTLVKQSELDGLMRELSLMRRIPDVTEDELNLVRAKIADREAELVDRAQAAAIIANQKLEITEESEKDKRRRNEDKGC